MKKSLIALAVLAASGAAMAQSSVSIYGIADVWFGSSSFKSTTGGVTTKASETVLESGGFSGSRLGFRGTEDLGGGLKANFVIETGFNIDQPGPTTLGNRQTYVGLSGGFGEVQLGNTYTAYDDLRGLADHTLDANFGSTDFTWIGYTSNPQNTVKYISPNISGFSAAVSYSLGEDKATNVASNKASNVVSLHATYANGPVFVGLGYQNETDNGFVPAAKLKNTLLTGSYDFGVAKLLASYNTAKDEADFKANEYQIGVEVPVTSNITVAGGYSQSKEKIAGVADFKASGYSAIVTYSLSKRSTVYGGILRTTYKDLTGSGDKDTLSVYAVGLRHAF